MVFKDNEVVLKGEWSWLFVWQLLGLPNLFYFTTAAEENYRLLLGHW